MQELIEKRNKLSYSDFDTWLLSNMDLLIEKEKEILIDTYKRGTEQAPLDFEWSIIISEEIPELLYKDGTPMRTAELSEENKKFIKEAEQILNQNK